MDKTALYQIWAPDQAEWSAWAKPVLFAREPPEISTPVAAAELPDLAPLSAVTKGAAVVFNLSGSSIIDYALAAARQLGLRPVPLFASSPPDGPWMAAVVPTDSIRTMLHRGAAFLHGLNLPANAAPAFLVDAQRRAPDFLEVPLNTFDNRSAVFAADFPSAALLRGRGINRCVIVRDPLHAPGVDLGYALLPWKKAGIEMVCCSTSGEPLEFTWPRGGFWGQFLQHAALLFSLKTSATGGFGRFVAESSGG